MLVNTPPNTRILALMEANSVTGPAKNLIGFAHWLKTLEGAATGFSIAVATFERNPDERRQNAFVEALKAAHIDTYIIRERYRFDPTVFAQLRNILAVVQPAILQTHNNKSHLLAKWSRQPGTSSRWLAFHHGDTYTDLKQRLYNQVDRLSLRSADRVVTVCRAFTARLLAFGVPSERIRVLHNAAVAVPALEEGERTQLRSEFGIGTDEYVILTIGRLSSEKGHADLLRAVKVLQSGSRPWKLMIAGSGPEQRVLREMTSSLGLKERVVFAGFRSDVGRLYGIADVFCLPSHSEGSSNVLLEAMMAQVPIVATAVGGNPEIVLADKTGLLVEASNPAALAQAIQCLIDDRKLGLKLAAEALSRAMSEFSLSTYRNSLLSFYGEALGHAGDR
jgi:glycosyltransferase involved in cell wall biosynthesis